MRLIRLGLAATLLAATSCASFEPTAAPVVVDPALYGWESAHVEPYRGKRDDIFFATQQIGYYGTGAGELFRTVDGGDSWTRVWHQPGTFVRALGFLDEDTGFIGNVGDVYPNVTDTTPLYRTRDGGRTLEPVMLGGATIKGICAIDIVEDEIIVQGVLQKRKIVHAGGRVNGPAQLLRSEDGGETFREMPLPENIGMILDVKFRDARTGFLFAGTRSDVRQSNALILKTEDGGANWREVYRSSRPLEISWKGFLVDDTVGYATVQNYNPENPAQVIVKTVDGGDTWHEIPLIEDASARQFGIGFVDRDIGWVGTAAGGFETLDGGRSWHEVALEPAVNKIRTHAANGSLKVSAIGTAVQFWRRQDAQ